MWSATLVVATEQDVGCFRDADDAAAPELHIDAAEGACVGRDRVGQRVEDAHHRGGARAGLAHVEAEGQRIAVVSQVDLDPRIGRVDVHGHLYCHAIRRARDRVVGAGDREAAGGQTFECVDHAPLAVVEPLGREAIQSLPARLVRESEQLPLAHTGGAQHGEEVAPPLVRHADAHAAHADDILDGLVAALHLHGGEDQRAFLVHVARRAVVGGGDGIAAIGLMRLGDDGEAVQARLVDHRHQDGVIGRVRAAVIGRVVQESVAPREIGVKLLHRGRHQIWPAQHVDRQALGGRQQVAVGGDNAAREVARRVEHARAPGTEERVGHLAADGLEALVEDRKLDAVHGFVARSLAKPALSRRGRWGPHRAAAWRAAPGSPRYSPARHR